MEGMHLDCMMGAPERVFHRCTTVLINDEEIPRDGDIVLERMFNESVIQMASLGETVLGKISPTTCHSFSRSANPPFLIE